MMAVLLTEKTETSQVVKPAKTKTSMYPFDDERHMDSVLAVLKNTD